jgi:hypothetical protein
MFKDVIIPIITFWLQVPREECDVVEEKRVDQKCELFKETVQHISANFFDFHVDFSRFSRSIHNLLTCLLNNAKIVDPKEFVQLVQPVQLVQLVQQKPLASRKSCQTTLTEKREEKCTEVEMLMPREVCTLAPRAIQKVS